MRKHYRLMPQAQQDIRSILRYTQIVSRFGYHRARRGAQRGGLGEHPPILRLRRVYIGQDNVDAAERMREMFYEAFRKLGENPHIGQERGDLTEKTVRFWPVHRNYMIVYDPLREPVRILRIYNAARDFASILPE